MTEKKHQIEILSPAGSFASLNAALNAGADAVYFGVGKLNMRAGGAVNFRIDDLPEVARLCHAHGAKAYLTVNTIIYNDEVEAVHTLCDAAKAAGIDACIAGDPAVLEYLLKIGLSAHLTVQANVCNLPAVRFFAKYADVMVLARELTQEQIAAIAEGIRRENICGPGGKPVQLEVFAHGAMCIGVSGKCGMSFCAYGKSANRGECLQNCRRRYLVKDVETGFEMELDHQFVMSPGDLCTVDVLDLILNTGVSVLKIEGRGRPADYVAATTRVYHEAVAAWQSGEYTRERGEAWRTELERVFNRGFWSGGYYLGHPMGAWCGVPGSKARIHKKYLGRITNFYSRISVAEMKIDTRTEIAPGVELLVTGDTSGAVETVAAEIRNDNGPVQRAFRGDIISFAVPARVRTGDKVYLLEKTGGNQVEHEEAVQ